MRIGIDCRLWSETGVGRYIRNLVYYLQKLDKKNNYILFFLPQDKERIGSEIQTSSFNLQASEIRWHSFEEQFKFPQIINSRDIDLMHFPYFSVPVFYNKPFVVTIHDLIINHYPTGQASTLTLPFYSLKLLGYKFVINQAAKKAKKIITVSNATKKEIIDHLKVSESKIQVTYEGIGTKFTKSISDFTGIAQDSKPCLAGRQLKAQSYFLYVGNAYPHKNLENLIDAFSKTRLNNIQLVFVGREDYFYKRLQERIKKENVSEKIIFLHSVSDEELVRLYKNAICLILPSLMEGFGLTALEAMANNCLVLASDIPSLKEICSDSAIYFNPSSAKDLEEKLKTLSIHTTEYEGLRKKAKERVRMFSWEKMAKQTLEIYENIQ
jgi:glycosyltransferase involved in cell wall biosynthesis